MRDASPDPGLTEPGLAPAARRRGRPAQLSRDRIVDAAATFDNLDELTMRALAERLEVRHGALYRWVENRDAVFDLISEVVVDRIIAAQEQGSRGSGWRAGLGRLAWSIHDEFLAVPGFASHLSRPHTHNAHSVDRLRAAGVALFGRAGANAAMADHSWSIFMTAMVGWLAVEEHPVSIRPESPSFELFIGVLLRGLPARDPIPGEAWARSCEAG